MLSRMWHLLGSTLRFGEIDATSIQAAKRATRQTVVDESKSSARMSDTIPAAHNAPAVSVEVRERLVEALNLDLIGPGAGHALASERLPGWVRPSNWYLTGFLVPTGAPPEQSGDADEDDDLDEMPDSAGLAEESTEERKAAKKGFFPSSMGLSFLVAEDADGRRDRPVGGLRAGIRRGRRRQGRFRLAAVDRSRSVPEGAQHR